MSEALSILLWIIIIIVVFILLLLFDCYVALAILIALLVGLFFLLALTPWCLEKHHEDDLCNNKLQQLLLGLIAVSVLFIIISSCLCIIHSS